MGAAGAQEARADLPAARMTIAYGARDYALYSTTPVDELLRQAEPEG